MVVNSEQNRTSHTAFEEARCNSCVLFLFIHNFCLVEKPYKIMTKVFIVAHKIMATRFESPSMYYSNRIELVRSIGCFLSAAAFRS